ncbi:MAG TPA: rhodanese-like domain-containing protein [Ideonella sp.]|uniref:rhodanese-like domain-containing protein n=1 Tax=Ideonella sp. TaxID=1929293 RepID=UPI002D1B84D5|nr:rhodanese-like domain-containing protein [Ideonella sp.]HSI50436.1 rhodanese-like domain-containing protein [Ideonella sp.]
MNSLNVQDLPAFVAEAAAEDPGQPTLLLDVREDWEVALAPLAVPGARTLHMPMNQVPARLAELAGLQPIVCFCHHGMRSAQVVAFLQRQGHEHVYNLAGGTEAWSTQVDAGVARY